MQKRRTHRVWTRGVALGGGAATSMAPKKKQKKNATPLEAKLDTKETNGTQTSATDAINHMQ